MMELMRRLSYWWNRRRLEQEMAEEMAFHREMMSAKGKTNFGNELRLREDAREMWGWTWLDRLQQDAAYGARVLGKTPAFTVTAVLVLVLGIGVPLSAFRVVLTDLRGGTVPDPDSLVRLTRGAPGAHMTTLTYKELALYAANAKSFRNIGGISGRTQAAFSETAAGTPERAEWMGRHYAGNQIDPQFLNTMASASCADSTSGRAKREWRSSTKPRRACCGRITMR
jgi:hypothetical protein